MHAGIESLGHIIVGVNHSAFPILSSLAFSATGCFASCIFGLALDGTLLIGATPPPLEIQIEAGVLLFGASNCRKSSWRTENQTCRLQAVLHSSQYANRMG